ncbi:uncharacterized protein [Ptychodera flava]|uniref:uncharacterized protein n=1 Tax=Ptychodera flava TaxID=63121 RepID=UPI00396A9543
MALLSGRRRRTLKIVVILLFVVVPIWFLINYEIINILQSSETMELLQRIRALSVTKPREVFQRSTREMAKSHDKIVIPNIVHYIWFGEKVFKLHHLLSILSVRRFLKPDKIFLHTDSDVISERSGPNSRHYWFEALEVAGVELVIAQPPTQIHGKVIKSPRDQSILARIQTLSEHGGIYVDNDVIVLKSFDILRQYDFVIARESFGLNPGIMLARQNATFLTKWLECFKCYNETIGTDRMPEDLIRNYSKSVYVENGGFRRLDHIGVEDKSQNIFFGNIDHSNNYALKLHYDFYDKEYTEYEIKYLNTTFGELARLAYFGDSTLQTMHWPSKPKESDPLLVPNIVHYIWFTSEEFKFHHFLSVKSAMAIQNAEKIVFHCDSEPRGEWWDIVREMTGPTLEVLHRDQPSETFGKPVIDVRHRCDITKVNILLEYGGVYLDTDAIIVKNVNPLRRYECTMGLDVLGLSNGVVMSAPKAKFMKLIYDSYEYYDQTRLYYNSKILPYEIASANIDLINIEPTRLTRPDWTDWWDMGRLWKHGYKTDWSHMHVIQLAYHYHGIEHNPEDIKTMNNTFGEIARYIYYGSKEIILDS